MFETMKRAMSAYGLAATLLVTCAASATAQQAAQPSAEPRLSPTRVFAHKSGEALFNSVCAACHMPGGKGASGAGVYPALASNPKLEAAGYPITVVLHGLKGMPPVGKMMTDEQVAEVVNYVRTHFGNSYEDKVTAQEVTQSR
ncbi:c-type cytochrome [Microvirga yunnanensis]|uniref:c-type cytochrome n=1 Tax=Microvirga yunnanensis TaxID=2953740 RepID=UPI0021C5EA31|nr:cytochrome c [Microvirga sp. HBU65207]